MIIQDFLQCLESKTGHVAKTSGDGYSTCCPSHDDSTPSLSISEGTDGKVLVNCFAGCSPENICQSLGINLSDLFPEKIQPVDIPARQKTLHLYQDENGNILFHKVRIEPGFDGKEKSFYCERTDENGEVVKSLRGCRKVLYRLPELQKAIAANKVIFLVEGEKDVDKLISYGLAATTSPESLKWSKEFSLSLQQADIVILYDMDKTGYERRDLLCKELYRTVKRLRVVALPGLEYQESHGKDISDWLQEGHTTDQLMDLVSHTHDFAKIPKGKGIRAVSLEEFLSIELPRQEMLLHPFLPTQGLCLLYAKRGVGKTHVALGIGYAVATGGTFLKWSAPVAKKVLYIDGEMPAAAMQERLKRISNTENLKPPDPSFFRLITPDLQDTPMPDLSTKEGRDTLEEFVQESDLVIIDNISTLFRSGVENEAESWQPVQDWALDLRRRGKSVLFIHHAAKAGQQRGTSKREDILDTVITLKQPQGYCADQGACFDVTFEKTRHFSGEDAAPFQVRLKAQDDGVWLWIIDKIAPDTDLLEVANALREGLTIEETAQKTGLTKSQVETRKKKAKQQNLL